MLETTTPAESPTPIAAGGAAPAHRQCGYTKSDGHKCRDWAIRGHNHCARHHRFLQWYPERPIEVPLLEDEASVVLLLSQTLRALAWGTIPVANGRMLLAGCRQAFSMQGRRLEMAKFRLRLRRLGIPEDEIFESPDEPASTSGPDAPPPELSPELCALTPDAVPDSVEVSAVEPTPDPAPAPAPRRARFRDLKTDWDKDLRRGENQMTDMYFKRYGETPEEFAAARATPFQNLAPEDPAQITAR